MASRVEVTERGNEKLHPSINISSECNEERSNSCEIKISAESASLQRDGMEIVQNVDSDGNSG